MRDSIPNDIRYIPIPQQQWCCVPACISMVMYRHHIPLLSQELLGSYLGLVVPKSSLRYFWNGKTGKKPKSGWGTRMGKRKFNPNNVFRKLDIPLRMYFKPIGKFPNLQRYKAYLATIESKDKDVLACFDWGTLYNKAYHGGHLCVIDRVNIESNEIRLIDPEYEAPKWRIVSVEKLKNAMEFHGKNEGGFWEFIKIKS